MNAFSYSLADTGHCYKISNHSETFLVLAALGCQCLLLV